MTPMSRDAWDGSVSARGYNADWWDTLTPQKEPRLWAEMEAIYQEEAALGNVPDWASEIVERMMELPMCGYYAYPANVEQILDAIAAQRCPDIVLRCYTVDPDRKVLLSYYVYCLDAWLKDASLTSAVVELSSRDSLGKDWKSIVNGIYRILGARTEIKSVVVERLIHRLRWWIKSLIWSDDTRDRFLLDVYSGDIRGDEEKWGAYGNSPFGDPYFAELRLPHVREMEEQIRAEVPAGKELLDRIHSTWLCAPKMFRYLEKLIVEIGSIASDDPPKDELILQCEDTYPDFDANGRHFAGLLDSLRAWLGGREEALPTLPTASPVNRWLVRLLLHKLVFHATYEENFSKLVGQRPHGRSGLKRPQGIGKSS